MLIRSSLITLLLSLTVLVCSVGSPGSAWAHSGGVTGYSGNPATNTGQICTNCHTASGTAPNLTLTGPTSLAPSSSGVYTLTITGGAAVDGGLDVSATAGTLQATGSNTKLLNGEVTQTSAISFTSGSLVFTFTLVAPSSAGSLTLYAAGLSANGSGSSGDNAAATTLAVTVTASAPQIIVTDSVAPTTDHQIPFGTVLDGLTSDQTVTVSNTGSADLTVGTISGPAAPFSIVSNNCTSPIAPGGSCTLTVRFAPTAAGPFNDTFDIPSDDPSTPTVTVSVSGTGLNNPPTAPTLVSPADGATGVGTATTLTWTRSTDPDNDPVAYHLYNCTDKTFATCTPVDVASNGMTGIYFAGSGLLFVGFVFARGGRTRKLILMPMIAMLLMTGALFTSCGNSGGVSSTPTTSTAITHQVSGLTSATTYYWKVEADDGKGGLASSPTWSFTTQ
jgi:hypothetical protein